MLLELAATLREQVLEPLLRARTLAENATHEPASARIVALVLIGARHLRGSRCRSAGGSTLSRRVRSDPPARRDFADPTTSPAVTRLRRVKLGPLEADIPRMDTQGARLLAARIRSGVSVGARIELAEAPRDDSRLAVGDRGVVDQINDEGRVVVTWDRGFATEIDPGSTRILTLAA